MIKLNIGQAQPSSSTSSKDPAKQKPEHNGNGHPQSSADPLDRRIIQFTHPQTGEVLLGTPLEFLPNYTHHSIQPGSRNLRGEPGIWALEMDPIPGGLPWVDNPHSGIFSREISDVNQVLGCKGKIDGIDYSFDAILQVGQNTVAYQLTNLATGAKSAIGLGRDYFDPLAGLRNYLERVNKGRAKFVPAEVLVLCDRILKFFPQDEAALFNKGICLWTQKDFPAAHRCFENSLKTNPNDPLTLLHSGAMLAEMGHHRQALDQLQTADELSEEASKNFLQQLPTLREPLHRSILTFIQTASTPASIQDLWLKYFVTPPNGLHTTEDMG